jgi:hypothetical protein
MDENSNNNFDSLMTRKLFSINKKEVINSNLKFDFSELKLLFKDYIDEDYEILELNEILNSFHIKYFYQNIYNKYNGLSESLANKRKKVCLKLLNIMKIIVRYNFKFSYLKLIQKHLKRPLFLSNII